MAFSGAHNFVLSNPVFADQRIVHYQSGIDILRESCAPEAAFDSDSRQYTPLCFPGTRLQHISDIISWATAQSTYPMYRMTGPAGVGKSTIAQTCAEKLRSQFRLGASFFFTIDGCCDHTRFFPSISYQLSSKSPDYHALLDKKLLLDRTLVKKQLRSQFRELIVEPLWELEQAGKQAGGKVILIDGLDECKDREAQREIIEIIITSVSTHTTPFYWAFFSRPEPQIEAAFADHRIASLCISTSLSCSTNNEIENYLRVSLQDILRRRGITTSAPWPSEQEIHALTSAAQGLYIYAATVLHFVGRMDPQYDPRQLLGMVIKGSAHCSSGGSTRTAWQELDAFYTLILNRVPNELHSSLLLFLSLMVLDHLDGEGQVKAGIRFSSNALRFTEIWIKMLCGELVAVVSRIKNPGKLVTDQDQRSYGTALSAQLSLMDEIYTQEEWLRFNHKSFFDFLCDPRRSGSFCVATQPMRDKLFQHLLELEIDYSNLYSFQSNDGLFLTANDSDASIAPDVHHVLSWPLDSELLNSSFRCIIFDHVGTLLLDKFFPYDDLDNKLLRRLGHVDHHKLLSIRSSWFLSPNVYIPGSTLGAHCVIKNVQGIVLCSTKHRDMLTFDAETFRRGILRLEQARVIRRYRPSSITSELPLFRCDSDGNLLSGLYIKGHGQMSTFWYWLLNPDMGYYREFETVNLAEGEKIFSEEIFDLWPDREDAMRG